MPSGAKKRKKAAAAAAAAKRKEDEQVATTNQQTCRSPTNSPPPPPHPQDKELEHILEMKSSENARESVAEESPSLKFPVSETPTEMAAAASWTEKQEGSTESAVESPESPVSDVKDVSIEFVGPKFEHCNHSLGGEGSSVTERNTEVVVEKLTEEKSVVSCEVQELLPTSSSPCEGESAPHAETIVESSNVPSNITTTTEATDAPLLEKRASLWNCCGLFDFFKGSQ